MIKSLLSIPCWPWYYGALRRRSRRWRRRTRARTGVAAIVVAYRRPFNMPQVLYGLQNQEFIDDIYVWHNLPSRHAYPGVENVQSDRNLGCDIRHFLALGLPQHRYFLFLDDDLAFRADMSKTVLEGIERFGERSVLGFFGRNIRFDAPERAYSEGEDVASRDDFLPVDLVKGRCHVVSWENLSLLARERPAPELHDDLRVNLCTQLAHRVPSYVLPHRDLLADLPSPFALWRRPGHYQQRDQSMAQAFQAGFRPPRLFPSK